MIWEYLTLQTFLEPINFMFHPLNYEFCLRQLQLDDQSAAHLPDQNFLFEFGQTTFCTYGVIKHLPRKRHKYCLQQLLLLNAFSGLNFIIKL